MAYCWVHEFPHFAWDEDGHRWDGTHNPFSGFLESDRPRMASDPSRVRARQDDLICNGNELGGGSVRLHQRGDQETVFGLMGYGREELQDRFGALLDALEYSAPPHRGIATGFDRLVMLLAGEESIREVFAFPKNQHGVDLMFDAPSAISTDQLDDVGLCLKAINTGAS
ncbi:MAG: amino acid--tRNA ligase-related protein [Thermomicrobiales bacterium]